MNKEGELKAVSREVGSLRHQLVDETQAEASEVRRRQKVDLKDMYSPVWTRDIG